MQTGYPTASSDPIDHQTPPITDKLVAEKKRLEQRLRQINTALDTLANNPEVQIALDAISRLGHL
jgi:hypothetical protein